MSLSYLEAVVVGALQGVTELFPVSSLGHSVILPALIGGDWATDLDVSAPESPYLAFIVGLHVATAAALLVFLWRDWVRIVKGFVSSIRHRRVHTDSERLAWLIILATIPIGLAGLLLEHLFRTVLGRPVPAAAFLIANGVILLVGERLRRRAPRAEPVTVPQAPEYPRTPRPRAGAVADPDAGITGREADLRVLAPELAGLAAVQAEQRQKPDRLVEVLDDETDVDEAGDAGPVAVHGGQTTRSRSRAAGSPQAIEGRELSRPDRP